MSAGAVDITDEQLRKCKGSQLTTHRVGELLRGISFPLSAGRSASAAHGQRQPLRLTLGLTPVWGRSEPAMNRLTRKRRRLAKLLFRLLRRLAPKARCTSVVVALNSEAALHTDDNNLGLTHTTTTGSFSGGSLWIHSGAYALTRSTKDALLSFDASRPHCVLAFHGTWRVTFTWYVHSSFVRCSPALRAKLLNLEARLPSDTEVAKLLAERARRQRGSKTSRLTAASQAWRHQHLKAQRGSRTRVQKNSKRGRARASNFVCKGCGRTGITRSGRGRAWCSQQCRRRYRT